jgi:hypothetical protein
METEQHTAEWRVGDWEIREQIKKFLKSNENQNTTNQNLWNTA